MAENSVTNGRRGKAAQIVVFDYPLGGELSGDFLDIVKARAEKDLFLQKEGSALPPALSEINFQYYIFWVFRY